MRRGEQDYILNVSLKVNEVIMISQISSKKDPVLEDKVSS